MALKLIHIRVRMQCIAYHAAREWSPAKLPLKMTSTNGDDVRCELYIGEWRPCRMHYSRSHIHFVCNKAYRDCHRLRECVCVCVRAGVRADRTQLQLCKSCEQANTTDDEL